MSGEAIVLDPSADRSRPGVLASLRSHALAIAGTVLACALLAYLVSFLLPTSYTAQTSIYLAAANAFSPTGETTADPVRFTADQVELVLTSDVLSAAGDAMVPPLALEEVRRSVTATGSAETSRVTVTVERPDAQQAALLADEVVAAYRQQSLDRVQAVSAAAQSSMDDGYLQGQIKLRTAAYGDGVAGVDPAVAPTSPSAPQPRQNALIGALIGLLLGTGLAVLGDQRRARRAAVADLDLLIGAPLITRYAAPASSALQDVVDADMSPARLHAAHDILAAIDVALEGRSEPSVLFLSWQRALTTTSVVVATGLAAARGGRKVVLIDGGLKDRGISALTDVDPGKGLETLADPRVPIEAAVRTWHVGDTELGVVPLDGWAPSPTGAAARPQVLRAATTRLEGVASLVLVDGPPLTERSLGLALGRGVDGVILVIDDETSIDDAHEMGRRIALAGVGVLGYVLAGSDRRGTLRQASWFPKRAAEGAVSLGVPEGSRRG